jgi:hypothetical protein
VGGGTSHDATTAEFGITSLTGNGLGIGGGMHSLGAFDTVLTLLKKNHALTSNDFFP